MRSRLVGIVVATVTLSLVSAASAARPSRDLVAEPAPFTMEVLVDGAPLPQHAARGALYVEAVQGREYAIRLRNNTAGRVAIALSVDGLNSIDARTTSMRRAAKWILDPWQTITLEGWQTSEASARRFYFTSEPQSYGAWLGKTSNLGVISAAVFRERRPVAIPYMNDSKESPEPQRLRGNEEGGRPSSAEHDSDSRSGLRDDLAATGIGRQVDHQVTRVAFDAEEAPAAILNVRYEFHDALVRLGVLPRATDPCDGHLGRRERASGFQDSGFAPDPYGTRCP